MQRGGISFAGVGYKGAPFIADGSVSAVALASGAAAVEGKAVTAVGNGVMGFGKAGDPLKGVIAKYETDGHMTVQFAGFREDVPGISAALPKVNDFVCVDGEGAVSAVASGNAGPAYAVSVDDTADVNTVIVFIG